MFQIYDGRESFYQWDLDRKLIVEDDNIDCIHFSNNRNTNSLVCEVYEEDGKRLVNVPNILLQDNFRISVYAFDDKHTKHCDTFNVIKRSKPEDYVYTEEELKVWDNLENRIVALEEGNIDLSAYATKAEIKTALDTFEMSLNVLESDVEIGEWVRGIYAAANNGATKVSFTDMGDIWYGYQIINVKPFETYYIDSTHNWSANAYIVADKDDNILLASQNPTGKQIEVKEEFVIPSNGAKLYIGKINFKSLVRKVCIYSGDNLINKTIIYDGDSIAAGNLTKLLADDVKGYYVNQAVGGGNLRSTLALGKTNHSVVDNLPNLPTNGDLYCFEGGINDYWDNAKLGTVNKADYTSELDTTTICGALEYIFRYALSNFIGKPICFIITHKIQNTAYKPNAMGNTFEDYRNAMVEVCNKYSIPYYDAFNESGLNGWNETQNNAYFINGDGCHPNDEGYKRYYLPQLKALFKRIIVSE